MANTGGGSLACSTARCLGLACMHDGLQECACCQNNGSGIVERISANLYAKNAFFAIDRLADQVFD